MVSRAEFIFDELLSVLEFSITDKTLQGPLEIYGTTLGYIPAVADVSAVSPKYSVLQKKSAPAVAPPNLTPVVDEIRKF